MTPETLFYIFTAILVISFIIDQVLDYLNAKHSNNPLPEELKDVFEEDEYILTPFRFSGIQDFTT